MFMTTVSLIKLAIYFNINLLPRFHVRCSVLVFYVFSTCRRHVALVFLD